MSCTNMNDYDTITAVIQHYITGHSLAKAAT